MASYYGRRNILNLQLPGHYRLYPPSHSEPVFDTGIGQLPSRSRVSAEHEANLQLTRAATRGSTQGSTRGSTQGSTRRSLSQERRRSGDENGDAPRPSHSNPAEGSRRTNDVPILAPPPAYTGAGVPLSRTISSGATLVASGSSGGRKSRVIQVNWRYHPSLTGPHQKRDRLIRYLSRKREILNDQFPEDFMDLLIAGQCSEADINKIEGLYKARIDHLNNWVIPSHLVGTRLCMGLLEIVDFAIVVLFIVALAVTGGRQEGLLEGAEVALILVILLTGGFINHVRIKRWQLRAILRNLSRDWSPLPSTSSTAADLVNAYIGGSDLESGRSTEDWIDGTLPNPAVDESQKPVMRWSMFRREGTVWTSWRPVVKVELIVPTAASRLPPPSDLGNQPTTDEDYVPEYSAREGAGERVVQFAT